MFVWSDLVLLSVLAMPLLLLWAFSNVDRRAAAPPTPLSRATTRDGSAQRIARTLTAAGVRLGADAREFAGSYGWCFKCNTPWCFIEHHDTGYTDGCGMFPLCVLCWSELTPAERLPFYRQLFDEWETHGSGYAEWADIERAVLAGG